MRIVVVDDSTAFRERVTRHLAQDPDMTIVGQAGDGRSAVHIIDDLRPDVVILDIYMPIADGFVVLRHVKDQLADTKVVVLTSDLCEAVQSRCTMLLADAIIDKADAGLELLPVLRTLQ